MDTYVNGYTLINSPNNLVGEFSDLKQTIILTYEKDIIPRGNVIVLYNDSQGEELASPVVLSGNVDEQYSAQSKIISGYKLRLIPENSAGLFKDQNQTIEFIYDKVSTSGAPITIKYKDSSGNQIAPYETLNGNLGEIANVDKLDIIGYNSTTAIPELSFSETKQEFSFIYDYNVDANPPYDHGNI